MERLESNSAYVECELDPNEFRRDLNDTNKSFTLTEIPLYLWSFLLCALTFLVTPVTNSVPYDTISKEGKKTKKYVIKQIKGLLQYGGYQTEEEFVETTYFVTDQVEQLDERLLESETGYRKLGDNEGVFYV